MRSDLLPIRLAMIHVLSKAWGNGNAHTILLAMRVRDSILNILHNIQFSRFHSLERIISGTQ